MKALYIISCGLFLTAIASELIAKQHSSNAIGILGRSSRQRQSEQTAAKEQVKAAVQTGCRFGQAGLVAAGLGLGLWIASFVEGKRKGKRLTPVVPLVLFIAYVIIILIMVV